MGGQGLCWPPVLRPLLLNEENSLKHWCVQQLLAVESATDALFLESREVLWNPSCSATMWWDHRQAPTAQCFTLGRGLLPRLEERQTASSSCAELSLPRGAHHCYSPFVILWT